MTESSLLNNSIIRTNEPEGKYYSIPQLLGFALLVLVLGQTLLKEYWSIFSYMAIAIISGLLVWVYKRSKWSLILLFLILNIFSYRERAGGIWGYFSILIFILSVFKKKDIFFPKGFFVAFFLIFVSSILGFIVTPPQTIEATIGGLIGLLSTLCLFFIASTITLDSRKVNQFFILIIILITFQFLITLNIRYQFINLPFYTPIIPGTGYGNSDLSIDYLLTIQSRPIGTFSNFELTAEWAGLCFFLLFPLLFLRSKKELPGLFCICLGTIMSVLIIINTNTRGPFYFLIVLAAFFSLYIFSQSFKKSRFRPTRMILIIALVFLVLLFGNYVGLAPFIERIQGTKFVGYIPDDRQVVWGLSVKGLIDFFPFGTGPLRSGDFVDLIGAASHSMYLEAPLYYGFFGGGIFLILMVYTVYRLIKRYIFVRSNGLNIIFNLSLILFWIFFLMDESKIEFFRSYAYQNFIFLMWGLTISTFRCNSTIYSK